MNRSATTPTPISRPDGVSGRDRAVDAGGPASGGGDARRRALVTGQLCASLAMGAYTTMLLLYLVREQHLDAARVALALSVAGVAALAVSPVTGRLAGRGGAARLAAAALLVQGGSAAGTTQVAGSFARFAVLAAGYAVAYQGQKAVRGALVAALAPAGGQAGLVARLRTVHNAGFSLGALSGGLALSANTPDAYRACLLAAAGCYGAAAARIARAGTRAGTDRGGAKPLSDRRFLAFVAASALQGLQYPVLTFAIPLTVATSGSLPRWTIAAAALCNTTIVIALQVPATRRLSEPGRAARVPAAAGLLAAGACLALAAVPASSTPAALALLGAAVLALSVAEVGQVASGDVVSFALSPDHAHGAYQGVYALAPNLAQTAGPWLLAAAVLPHGRAGWLAAAALLALAGPLTALVARMRAPGEPPPDVDAGDPALQRTPEASR